MSYLIGRDIEWVVWMANRKKQVSSTVTPLPEQAFADELEIFRGECEGAAQFLYAYLSFHAVAGDCKPVRDYLNKSALFWNTALGALQTAFFVVLGRIFDDDTRSHNVGKLLRIAQKNPAIFSKGALARRKQNSAAAAPLWLAQYLTAVYAPSAKDFERLERHLSKNRQIYKTRYVVIRHKFIAHKELSDATELFERTNIREMQRMLTFLISLHEALWQMFHNGQKPVLRPVRHSVASIRKRPTHKNGPVHERIVSEVEHVLLAAAGVARSRRVRT